MTAQNVQVLLKVAAKLNVTVEVDVEFCNGRKCTGACITSPSGVVIKLVSFENEGTLAHELVHAFQRMTGDYLWEEEDLEFWCAINDISLDVLYVARFSKLWESEAQKNPNYFSSEKRRREFLAYYVGWAENGMNLFWRIAKEVLASR